MAADHQRFFIRYEGRIGISRKPLQVTDLDQAGRLAALQVHIGRVLHRQGLHDRQMLGLGGADTLGHADPADKADLFVQAVQFGHESAVI